tara:strand:- start:29069 stop:30616 length:1548 start_codon:yes stop_codon:yes gene_type:complete
VSFQVPRSNRLTGGVGDYEGTEHGRNIENALRTAVVAEVDLQAIRVRVVFGGTEGQEGSFLSGWLPMVQPASSACRAGLSSWQPPQVGDTVYVLCPGGELAVGQVLPVNFMRPEDAPFGDRAEGYEFGDLGDPRGTVYRKLFSDGTLIEYDHEALAVRVETPGSILAHACGQVIVKSPFIRLDGTVHVTGKLMCSDQIMGMKSDLSGTDVLKLLGDPIELNEGGGVFGIAASLISTFGLGTFSEALGAFGDFGGFFGDLVGEFAPLAELGSILDVGGLVDSIPIDILGAGFDALGVSNMLPELSNVLGFAAAIPTGQGIPTDPWGMAGFALDIASDFGLEVPAAAGTIVNNAFNGFEAVQSWINDGSININQLVGVAQNTGLLTTDQASLAGTVSGLIGNLSGTQGASVQDSTGAVSTVDIATATSGSMMDGIRGAFTSITDAELAENIWQRDDLVENWDAILRGGIQPGDMISEQVNAGNIDIETLLGLGTQMQRNGNGAQAGDDCNISVNCQN